MKKRDRQRKAAQRRADQKRRAGKTWRKKLLIPGAPSARPLREMYAKGSALEAQVFNSMLNQGPLLRWANGDPVVGVYSGEEAWRLLEGLFDQLIAHTRESVARYGSADWLWFLRRLRGQFHINSISTTEPYIQAVAEIIACNPSRPSTSAAPDRLAFVPDAERLVSLYHLRANSVLAYKLDAVMKRCAKGEAVEFFERGLPFDIRDDALDAAIAVFDERNASSRPNLLDAVGVDPGLNHDLIPGGEHRIGGLIPYWMLPGTRRGNGLVDPRDPSPATFSFLDFDRLPALASSGWAGREQVALIVLLWACFNITFRDDSQTTFRITPALQWGYMLMSIENYLRPAIEEILHWLIHDDASVGVSIQAAPRLQTADEVFDILYSLEPRTRPPIPGCPLHMVEGQMVVDLVGASRRLFDSISRPIDGGGTQAWSDQFEVDVQAIVDDSKWAPPADLRVLCGRKIKRDGNAFTNIDAVAYRNRTLLLISCKGIAFTADAGAGDFAKVNSIQRNVAKYVKDWNDKVTVLRSEPELLRVQLPDDCSIQGIVVLPAVPFVADPALYEVQGPAGLRPAVSSDELARALQSRARNL